MSSPNPPRTALEPSLIEAISDRLATLADPTRIRLMCALRAGEASVQELADLLDLDRRNTGHHLIVLLRAGVLARRTEGKSVVYSIGDWGAAWLIDRAAESVVAVDS